MSCYSESKSNQKLNPDNRGSHLKKSTANITLKLANNNRKKRIINNKSEPPLVNINHHITTRKIRSKQQQPPPPPLPPQQVTVATCEIYNKNNETQISTTNSVKLDLDQTIESTTSQQQPQQHQHQQQQLNQTSSTRPSSALSDVETAILKSTMPIQIDETDEITVNGEHGIWANKSEVINWKGGDIPLSEYEVNEDSQPELINKKIHQHLEYIQELAIRYLKPPTPPPPGEIVIKQDPNQWIPPAPPLIIRQQPPRPATPEPLVIREQPPPPPPLIGRKLIKISGKKLPPPPRKVIIERLAPLPSKPQSVIIERWLPYNDKLKRKVIFTKSNRAGGADGSSDPVVLKPKNIIVQWEPPSVVVKQDFRYLGTIKANPVEYVQRYGDSLKSPDELPYFIKEMKTPDGIVLASDYTRRQVPELEGDLEALKYIDLDEEGLSEYKPQLEQHKQQKEEQKQLQNNSITNIVVSPSNSSCCSIGASYTVSTAISEIFSQIDTDNDGKITCDEASKILFRLNNRLINNYDETELVSLITARSTYGNINLYDFKRIFEKMLV